VAARGDLAGGMQICLQSCRSFQSPGQPAAAAGPRSAKRPGTAGKLAMEGRRHTTIEVLSRSNLEYGHRIFALRRPREVLWADQKDSPHGHPNVKEANVVGESGCWKEMMCECEMHWRWRRAEAGPRPRGGPDQPEQQRGVPMERPWPPQQQRGVPVERPWPPRQQRGVPVEREWPPRQQRGIPMERQWWRQWQLGLHRGGDRWGLGQLVRGLFEGPGWGSLTAV
jgi:hypothetical protein